MTLEVLDLFLTRLFGSEGLSAVADAKEAVKGVLDPSLAKHVCEKVTGRDEHWAVVEELQQQVHDLTRQFSALQRQLQMQGEASQVATSIGRRVAGTERVSDVACTFEELVEDVTRLKEAERKLDGRMAAAETRATESEWVLWAEIQRKIETIDLKTDPLGGIIAHLTRQCGGNVHKEGVVTVTASGCLGAGSDPKNVVDLGSESHFCSDSAPDSWICYDFEKSRVTPTSYSIRSYRGGPGYNHPKSWVLEVSNDGTDGSWVVLDSRKNNFILNESLPRVGPSASSASARSRRTTAATMNLKFARSSSSALCADERAKQRK